MKADYWQDAGTRYFERAISNGRRSDRCKHFKYLALPRASRCFEKVWRVAGRPKEMKTIDIDLLKEWISYNPNTGIFHWKKQPCRNVRSGDQCRATDKDGYIKIGFRKNYYRAHRIAFAIHYGKWPEGQIDHINRIKSDNRISNLRQASCSENGRNCPKRKSNRSGVVGVFWHKSKNRWHGGITLHGKLYSKTFAQFEEAVKWRIQMENNLYGEFAANLHNQIPLHQNKQIH